MIIFYMIFTFSYKELRVLNKVKLEYLYTENIIHLFKKKYVKISKFSFN